MAQSLAVFVTAIALFCSACRVPAGETTTSAGGPPEGRYACLEMGRFTQTSWIEVEGGGNYSAGLLGGRTTTSGEFSYAVKTHQIRWESGAYEKEWPVSYYVEPDTYPDGTERADSAKGRHTIALKVDQSSKFLPGQENAANPVYMYCYLEESGGSPATEAASGPCELLAVRDVEAMIGTLSEEPAEYPTGKPYCVWSSPGQQVRVDVQGEDVDEATFESMRQGVLATPNLKPGEGDRIDGVGDAAYWGDYETLGDYGYADLILLAANKHIEISVKRTGDAKAAQEAALAFGKQIAQRVG